MFLFLEREGTFAPKVVPCLGWAAPSTLGPFSNIHIVKDLHCLVWAIELLGEQLSCHGHIVSDASMRSATARDRATAIVQNSEKCRRFE